MTFIERYGLRILIGATILALIGAIITVSSCQQTRTAKTEANVSKGQAGAAMQSGADAAGTIGNRMAADAVGDALTKENSDAIHKADGADAPVAAGVRDAGLAGLCRRAAYSRDPKCLQHANPR